ncbi:MAG: ABC transporter substrate-binding protein [Thermoplasmata archaeon]|nr:ABC transporter substrate-binding protein [Thermoplasmata archaeon]
MHESVSSGLFGKGRLHGLVSITTAMCMLFSALATLAVIAPPANAVEDPYYQYRVGTVSAVDTFNPFSMTSGTSWSVAHMMYEFLYAVGPDMNEVPQLAESHEMSPDGKVWTYYLADDSYFHDGVQVTAHDVAFTFNMIINGGKQTALYKGYIEGIVSVVATNDYTVQITLEEPKATMLGLIVPILPEHIWSDVEADGVIKTVEYFEDTEYFPDGPVGSGPLVLAEYSQTGDFVRLLAHEQYHQHEGLDTDRINVDEVLLLIYENEQLMTADLQTGVIDAVDGVPPLVWETVLGYDDVEGQTPTAHILEEFGFNCASPEWRTSLDDQGDPNFPDASTNYETCNLSVRQAIAMATDITFIAEEIHQGLAVAADSLIPTATPFWHYDVPDEEYFHFDIEAANDLLNESGYHAFDGTDFGFAGVRENESSGARLEFDFYVIRSIDIDKLTANQMKIWWEQIGVKVNIIPVSEGVLYGIWFDMGYDMFIWSWWPDVDPTFLLSVLTTDEIPTSHTDTTAWSDAFYSNPEYDQMYLDQQKLMDPDERQAMVFEMQRIVYRDCPYICLVYPASLVAYRTDKYENFPDMELNAGISPSSFWYYFEITPIGGVPVNEPPYDVDAGDDVTIYVGDRQTFRGSGEDLESSQDELNWTWVIDEDGVETTLYGQTIDHTFDIIGIFEVALTVEDPEGASSSDSLWVTVEEIPEGGLGWITGYVEDTAGDPITEALVTIIDGDSSENTDELGMYNISVEPGTYDLVASADGYSNDTDTVSVEKDFVTWSNFTLGMTSGSVTGQVLDSVTEEAVAGALVKLFESGEEVASYSKKTDDDGSFEIFLVDEGTYEVVVSKVGFETNDTVDDVTVTPGEVATLVIYLTADDEKDGGLSTAAIAMIAALAIIAAVAVAALLLKRKKGSEPDLPEDQSPIEQTVEPPEPPET